MKEYSETHQRGFITLENIPKETSINGDLGIQIAEDGRVWICIDGIALLRFKPNLKTKESKI